MGYWPVIPRDTRYCHSKVTEQVTGTSKRVVLAADDTRRREGLARLLKDSGFEIAGQAADAPGLLALVREHHPDLAIIDIRMPPDGAAAGSEAARVIRGESAGTAILLLSAHAEPEQATELLATGRGVGYLLKDRVIDVAGFTETVARVAEGGTVVDPAIVQELFASRRRDDPLRELTEREREVLELMAQGRSNAGIAQRLWITEGTVEMHVHSIMNRMHLPETGDDHRRVLAVLAYLESRLTLPPVGSPLACRSFPASAPARSPRITDTDRSGLGRKPSAGLAAMRSA